MLIGSEGTLAVTTEITVKVQPRASESATVLAPFGSLEEVAGAVPRLVSSGINPTILEYIDVFAMAGIARSAELDLGVPAEVQAATSAYLVVVLEGTQTTRLDEDVESLATQLAELGALEVYVLPPSAGDQLIAARERAFFAAKTAGADDIIDAVIPRASIPGYLAEVAELATARSTLVTGCGHVGDGNVHLSLFQPDAEVRHDLIEQIFAAAIACGGAISGEHGIGTEKLSYFLDTVDPTALALMRSIKSIFDPQGILGPDRLLGKTGDNS